MSSSKVISGGAGFIRSMFTCSWSLEVLKISLPTTGTRGDTNKGRWWLWLRYMFFFVPEHNSASITFPWSMTTNAEQLHTNAGWFAGDRVGLGFELCESRTGMWPSGPLTLHAVIPHSTACNAHCKCTTVGLQGLKKNRSNQSSAVFEPRINQGMWVSARADV